MFDIKESALPGCLELAPIIREDPRGRFVKTFHRDFFAQHGMATNFTEAYYSVSNRGVLRGMHFQLPPHDHAKLVYCVQGEIVDAAVDLRVGSPTYGRHMLLTLSAARGNLVYLPSGMAHGFLAISETATMVYNVTTVYAPASDTGILWSSAGIPWPMAAPLVSERDAAFTPLGSFRSPFLFGNKS